MRVATRSMSPYARPISSSSRADKADNDLRVTRVSFHAATVANALVKIEVNPAVVITATGLDVLIEAIAMFL